MYCTMHDSCPMGSAPPIKVLRWATGLKYHFMEGYISYILYHIISPSDWILLGYHQQLNHLKKPWGGTSTICFKDLSQLEISKFYFGDFPSTDSPWWATNGHIRNWSTIRKTSLKTINNFRQNFRPVQTIINHHEPSLTIINHHEPSLTITIMTPAQIAIQALVQHHDAQDGSLVSCEAAKQLARQQGPFIDVLSWPVSSVEKRQGKPMGKPRCQKRKPWIQQVKKGIFLAKSIQETIYFLDFLFPPFLGLHVQFPMVQIWMVIWGNIVFPTPTTLFLTPMLVWNWGGTIWVGNHR